MRIIMIGLECLLFHRLFRIANIYLVLLNISTCISWKRKKKRNSIHRLCKKKRNRKMCTDFGSSAISVCWRSSPFSRQSHASNFPPQDSDTIDGAMLQGGWSRFWYTDTTRLRHRATWSDRSIMRYRANWAQTAEEGTRADSSDTQVAVVGEGERDRQRQEECGRCGGDCGMEWGKKRERYVECKRIGRETVNEA